MVLSVLIISTAYYTTVHWKYATFWKFSKIHRILECPLQFLDSLQFWNQISEHALDSMFIRVSYGSVTELPHCPNLIDSSIESYSNSPRLFTKNALDIYSTNYIGLYFTDYKKLFRNSIASTCVFLAKQFDTI